MEQYKPLCSSGYQSGTSSESERTAHDSESSPLSPFDDCLGQASLDVFPGDIMVTIHDYSAEREDELSFPHASLVQVKFYRFFHLNLHKNSSLLSQVMMDGLLFDTMARLDELPPFICQNSPETSA